MTYLTNAQEITINGAAAFSTFRRRLFGAFLPANHVTPSQVTDDAILRAIAHLNDQQLGDIGVCRKIRKSTLRSSGRGMSPISIVEFDYFWIEI